MSLAASMLPPNDGRAIAMTAALVWGCISIRETAHGYWWSYAYSDDEPEDTLTAAIRIAGEVAATEARKREFLDVAIAQREAQIDPDRMLDDQRGKAVAAIGDFSHRASLPSASLPSYPVTLTKPSRRAGIRNPSPNRPNFTGREQIKRGGCGPRSPTQD
jgi:hypothetical protein